MSKIEIPGGYLPLWRKIQNHWLWQSNEPYDCRSAWIDLLFLANHEEGKAKRGTNAIPVRVGQHLTSLSKLADRWHWSRNRVRRYLDMLEKDNMIVRDSTRGGSHCGTLLTIVNYEKFRVRKPLNGTLNETMGEPLNEPLNETQTINKKDKELKERKRKPAPPSDGGEWQ